MRTSRFTAWAILVVLLSASAPLFVCMPLWGDTTLYDLAARNVLQGGVHYRDVFDTNLPGMVWVHLAVRSLLGWSAVAFRSADLAVFLTIVWLLVRWRPAPQPGRLVWAAVALCALYFSLPETCHCQRDTWMLLPALFALSLRRRQLAGLFQASSRHIAAAAFVEGCCWAAACWIKPHVMVPALCSYLLAAVLAARASVRWNTILIDAVSLLAGGLLIGAAGCGWLYASGSWPYYWHVMLDWNPEYYATMSFAALLRLREVLTMFAPWGLVHLLAVPLAVRSIRRALVAAASTAAQSSALLGACYLGWLLQAGFLQARFDYVNVPAVLLALGVIAEQGWPVGVPAVAWLAGSTALATLPLLVPGLDELRPRAPKLYRVVFDSHHAFVPSRIVWWPRCWSEGSTPTVQNGLRAIDSANGTNLLELERVADYLRGQHVSDGEVTCYHNSTHPLYLELGVKPSTPYLHLDTFRGHFPSHRHEIASAIAHSGQRFVVSDLRIVGLSERQADAAGSAGPLTLPPRIDPARLYNYPWTEPIVFRAGRYVVHAVRPLHARAAAGGITASAAAGAGRAAAAVENRVAQSGR